MKHDPDQTLEEHEAEEASRRWRGLPQFPIIGVIILICMMAYGFLFAFFLAKWAGYL